MGALLFNSPSVDESCIKVESQSSLHCGKHAINNLWQQKNKLTFEMIEEYAKSFPISSQTYIKSGDIGMYTIDFVEALLKLSGASETRVIWRDANKYDLGIRFNPKYSYILHINNHYVALKPSYGEWCLIDSRDDIPLVRLSNYSLLQYLKNENSLAVIRVKLF